jgi:NADPH:quinone reductase-like Zn-dependent oxidoreductase
VKAVRIHEYGGPEVLVYEDAPKPEAGEGRVLVRVEAASVNPVDVAVREDRFPTPKQPPKILGSDGAGVVEAVGPGVDDIVPGEEVFFSGLGIGSEGSYAEYAVITEAQAVTKPPELSFAEAAAIGMTFPAAYYGLVTRGEVHEGETVLIQGGAGGVGTAAIQLAKARGARVLTTVTGERARQVVRELGADAVVDFMEQDVEAEIERLTDGRGPDLIHEMVISENLPADVRMVAKGGRIVCTGQGPRPDGSVPISPAIAKDVTLLFMNLANAGRAGIAAIAGELAALAAEGALRPVIGETLPLSEARRAHELLEGEHVGKIVLLPRE